MIRIFRYIILSAFLFIIGCGGGEEYVETGSSTTKTSEDCVECHGTTQSTASIDAIKSDIVDTHYDNWRLDPTGNWFTTGATTQIEGYVLDNAVSWAADGMGYVTKANPNQCAASCHDYHNTHEDIDLMEIDGQWYSSGHANIYATAFTYNHISGSCIRCHSGIGYAQYVDPSNTIYPNWTAWATNAAAHHITCNACHDAQGYPTKDNQRLRKTGSVKLVSGSSTTYVVDSTLDAGASATCITCHQGRESGGSVYKKFQSWTSPGPIDAYDYWGTISNFSFINPHYMPAGAVVFGLKGFEYSSMTYTAGNAFHQTMLCTGCHMANLSSENMGGHTMRPATSVCEECHGSVKSFEEIGAFRDMDGDGVLGRPMTEIDGLKTKIEDYLKSQGIYYDSINYPYFWNDPTCRTNSNPDCRNKTWTVGQLEAAFNFQFVNKEGGAYVHNFRYAVQLLRDSYEKMTGTTLAGSRPSTGDDRPATVYTYP